MTSSILSQALCVLWHSNAFIEFLACSWCFPDSLDHFFAYFAPLPSIISMFTCPSVTCPLLPSYEIAESAVNSGKGYSIYYYFFYVLNWWSVCWLLLDLFLRPCYHSDLLFLFTLVNLFQKTRSECTDLCLPTSTSPFVGNRRGSFPLIQLLASFRYALFQLLAPPLLSHLALLWYALVSPTI